MAVGFGWFTVSSSVTDVGRIELISAYGDPILTHTHKLIDRQTDR